MFHDPEDLHRTHLLQHAELIKNLALERLGRLARADHRPLHRLRETTHYARDVIRRRQMGKRFIALFTRDSHRIGIGATAQPNRALVTVRPPASVLSPPDLEGSRR